MSHEVVARTENYKGSFYGRYDLRGVGVEEKTFFAVLEAVFTAYFGRKRGAVKGTENYKADKSAIRDELGVKEKGK